MSQSRQGTRDWTFEEHRIWRCLEPGVDHGRIRFYRHQCRTCETFDRRQADSSRGERGPDGGTGQRRHQPGQPVAGEDSGPQQHEDVGPRRNPEATERQHPVVQQAIEAAVESERQVDRERQADGVDDPPRSNGGQSPTINRTIPTNPGKRWRSFEANGSVHP